MTQPDLAALAEACDIAAKTCKWASAMCYDTVEIQDARADAAKVLKAHAAAIRAGRVTIREEGVS